MKGNYNVISYSIFVTIRTLLVKRWPFLVACTLIAGVSDLTGIPCIGNEKTVSCIVILLLIVYFQEMSHCPLSLCWILITLWSPHLTPPQWSRQVKNCALELYVGASSIFFYCMNREQRERSNNNLKISWNIYSCIQEIVKNMMADISSTYLSWSLRCRTYAATHLIFVVPVALKHNSHILTKSLRTCVIERVTSI